MIHQLEKVVDACFACWPRPAPKRPSGVKLVAHRGAHNPNQCIENTLPAFEKARQLGCFGIELDVRSCADGVLVINHDLSLKRIWGGDFTLNTVDFKTLRQTFKHIPSLEEVVSRFGQQIHLFIELKSPFDNEKALAEVLAPLTPCQDYHLLSLDETTFKKLQLFPPACQLLVPMYKNVQTFCDFSLERGLGGVLGHYYLLKNKQIEALRRANQLAGVGLIDSKYSLYRELHRGIDLLFSNRVEALFQYLQALD